MAGKTIVITGGVSGIGLAITKSVAGKYSNTKLHIAILDINAQDGEQAVGTLRGEFPNATFSFHHTDVSSWDSQSTAFSNVYQQQGKIDIVFPNAGIPEQGTLVLDGDKPVKPNLKTLDVDLTGVIYTVSLAIFYISKNAPSPDTALKGSIVCTASNSGLYPLPLAPIYTTAKYGIVGLVRGLAGSLGHEKIQINGIAPCVVETQIGAALRQLPGIIFTPLSTVTKAVDILLTDSSLNGKIAEASDDRVTFAEPPPYVDESTKVNLEILTGLAGKIWRGELGAHGPPSRH